eukprot:643179-Prymnesium_polylepis.1
MFGSTPAVRIAPRNFSARCQSPPFSQADMAAPKLMTFGSMPEERIASNSDSACSSWPPFPHAEIAALKL